MRRKKKVSDLMGWVIGQVGLESSKDPEDILAGARLFDQHTRLSDAADKAMSLLGGAGARATEQRTALDRVREFLLSYTGQHQELRGQLGGVRESWERLKLIALNASLEGARLGEPHGTALVRVSEELRGAAEQGSENTARIINQFGDLERGGDTARRELEQARGHAQVMANELLAAQAAQRLVNEQIGGLGAALSKLAGTDPELAQTVNRAAEHAEGLLDALSELSKRSQASGKLETLVPVVSELRQALVSVLKNKTRDNSSRKK